jgi:hypothetical protein
MNYKKMGFALSLVLCLTVFDRASADDIDLSIGIYQVARNNWIGTTGAEYGSGPMVILEASKPVSRSIDISIVHKSYLLTGAPFNDNYESSFTAIGFKWRITL